MENSSTDLQLKYHKLATEFAKMRAQTNVLKKAVIEEQSKNVELKDEVRAKDQAFRKAEQDIDSLSFRNTQLEKRVGFLQDELSSAIAQAKNKNKGGSKNKGHPDHESSESAHQPVFDYELLSKIEENIQLHKLISSMEETHRKEITDLKEQLAQKSDLHDNFNQRQQQEAMDALEAEKLSMSYSIQNNLDEIEAYKEQVIQLQEKILNLSAEFDSKLTALQNEQKVSNEIPCSQNPFDTFDVPIRKKEESLIDISQLLPVPELDKELIGKLTAAEQQKEHWAIEYELLKMKYSKIFMKWEEAKDVLKALGKDELISGDITPSSENVQSFTTMIGKIEIVSEDYQTCGRSYEKEVKEYLTNKLNKLIGVLQMAESKAVSFQAECKSLERLLAINSRRCKETENLLESNSKKYCALQEELQTTKENYELQLSTLTEHLANMNEKLAFQKDKIDELKFQINSKGSKQKK